MSAGRNTLSDWLWQTLGVRSAARSMSQRWSISKAVLKTSFSRSERNSRCCTEPSLATIEDQVSSVFSSFSLSSCVRYLLRTVKEPLKVLWVKLFAAIGSIPGEAPPQMIEIDAVGASDILLEKRSWKPKSAASGQAPRSFASFTEAASACSRIWLKMRLFQTVDMTLSIGMPLACRKEWKPITPRPTERSRMAE